MKRLLLAATLAVAACSPNIPHTDPTPVVTARFDPSAAPAVVPSPNDLATNPATGLLAVPVPAGASGADKAFIGWLNTLDGFPPAAGASTTFDGRLDPASAVVGTTVRVFDLDASNAAVTTTATVTNRETMPGDMTPYLSTLSVAAPAGGWTSGHRYAIAIIGGANGVKAETASAGSVVGSATWSFLRLENSLVTCETLTDPNCHTTTELIPSNIKDDPAKRLADQDAKAKQLEALRRKYKPAVDYVISTGVAREDIAILWTFKIATNPIFEFNPAASPPKVPTPTNLIISGGKVNIPIDPAWSPAYQEFVGDYLNQLNGFPVSSPGAGKVIVSDADGSTVNKDTVLVFDAETGASFDPAPTIAYDVTTRGINVLPPTGGWGRGKKVAIAVLGGADGVQGTNGKALAASDAWALARSPDPLVDCETLGPTCKSVVHAAPITDLQAIGLEGLRRAYAPVLDALEAQGIDRMDVSGLWVFSTVNQPEVTFNLASATPVIPFPSNQFLRTADDIDPMGHLTFPVPPGPSGALFAGLNTLNGFSTTAPIASENSETLTALDEGNIDDTTLAAGTGFKKLAGAGPLMPKVKTCLNCTSSMGATAQPEQLQWVPELPLEGLSRYAAYVTGDLKDTDGRPVSPAQTFAIVRLKNSLLDGSGKSTLPVISDAQATALEPYRLRFKTCLDDLEAQGLERKKIALGFCVTTQSTVSVVRQLAGVVAAQPASALPDFPTMLVDSTTTVKGTMTALGLPSTAIGPIFLGNMVLPFGLNGTGDTLNPNPAQWTGRKAPFYLFMPAATPPAGGWPVVIFGHGLTSRKEATMAIANSLAAGGFATLAIDVVYHGERTTCVGSKSVLMASTDDAACANPTTQMCDATTGRCIARDQSTATACNPAGNGDATCLLAGLGQCQAAGPNAGKCEGGDFLRGTDGKPVIAAWNYLNLANLFATRDNFRYTGSVDFAQVVRVIRSMSATSLNAQLALAGAAGLAGGTIHYAGQSLGTFNGAIFAAANDAPNRIGLNVPGSSQVDVLLTAPGFAAQRAGFLASLAQLGLVPGTPGFDQFIVLARTIMDPADSQNMSYAGVHSANTNRRLYFQSIEGDQVLPNAVTDLVVNAANQDTTRTAQVFRFLVHSGTPAAGFIPAAFPAAARHGFLLTTANNPECNPMTATCATVVAQTKLVTFLATGTAP
jgi:dienelactone hydrolase